MTWVPKYLDVARSNSVAVEGKMFKIEQNKIKTLDYVLPFPADFLIMANGWCWDEQNYEMCIANIVVHCA